MSFTRKIVLGWDIIKERCAGLFAAKVHQHTASEISDLPNFSTMVFPTEYGDRFANTAASGAGVESSSNKVGTLTRTGRNTSKTINVHYLKFSNGLKICWGETILSGSDSGVVCLPLTYDGTDYMFIGCAMNHDAGANLGYADENGGTIGQCRHPTYIDVNTSMGGGTYSWICIGK